MHVFQPTTQEIAEFALKTLPAGDSCLLAERKFYQCTTSTHLFKEPPLGFNAVSFCNTEVLVNSSFHKASLLDALADNDCPFCLSLAVLTFPSYELWRSFFSSLMYKEELFKKIRSFSISTDLVEFEELLLGFCGLTSKLFNYTKELAAEGVSYYTPADAIADIMTLLSEFSSFYMSLGVKNQVEVFAVAAWLRRYASTAFNAIAEGISTKGFELLYASFKKTVLDKVSHTGSGVLSAGELDAFCLSELKLFQSLFFSESLVLKFLPEHPVLNQADFPNLLSWMKAESRLELSATFSSLIKKYNEDLVSFENTAFQKTSEVWMAWNCSLESLYPSLEYIEVLLPYLSAAISGSGDSPWLVFALPEFLSSLFPYSNLFFLCGKREALDDKKVLETTISFFSSMSHSDALNAARLALQ